MTNEEIARAIIEKLLKKQLPTPTDFSITLDEFGDIVETMLDYGLLKNVTISVYGESDEYDEIFHQIDLTSAIVTEAGREFYGRNLII